METIKLRGFGPHSSFVGARICELAGNMLVTIVEIAEPAERLRLGGWHRESAWRPAVMRHARRIVRGEPYTAYIIFDPQRDNAETVLL